MLCSSASAAAGAEQWGLGNVERYQALMRLQQQQQQQQGGEGDDQAASNMASNALASLMPYGAAGFGMDQPSQLYNMVSARSG